MALVIIGTFCGHVGYRPLGSFCQKYREQLWSLLEIEESFPCPSYSTLRRTLLDVPPERWETVFNVWALATLPHRENRCVSIDGKSIKCTSSGGQTNEQDFVSIVSLYAHEEDGVLQMKVMNNKQRSEIDVARELIARLQEFPTRQCLTLDALHTQTETVAQITASGHDYLIAVKANQPTLYRAIEETSQNREPLSQCIRDDSSHGRQVRRQVSVFEAPSEFQKKWQGLQSVIVVERSGQRQNKPFIERAYYLSSQRLSADAYRSRIQGHWSIENQLHWVKDVTFSEDFPNRRGGYSPVNWAILFSWFITLARRAKFRTVPEACRVWANQIPEIFALLS